MLLMSLACDAIALGINQVEVEVLWCNCAFLEFWSCHVIIVITTLNMKRNKFGDWLL
jgi:hypothetical protein